MDRTSVGSGTAELRHVEAASVSGAQMKPVDWFPLRDLRAANGAAKRQSASVQPVPCVGQVREHRRL